MKNITVSVGDEVYRQARIHAAEREKSVSALVSEYLASLTDQDQRFARLAAQQDRIFNSIAAFKGGDRLTRDEVHDRALR